MQTLWQDLRFAWHMLRKNPGFTIVAVLTLALGIGANTAIFSFVDAVLLSPLPYPRPEEIVIVLEKPPHGERNGISTLNFLDWKGQNTVFTAIAGRTGAEMTLTGVDAPVQLNAMRVSASYFDILGLSPTLGRGFAADEDQLGKDHVVVLSHKIWESRFGADPSIIRRDINLDGTPYQVIGVLPPGAPFDHEWEDLLIPLAFQASDMTRNYHWMGSIARLKPGVTLQEAQAQMKLVAAQIEHDYADSNKGWSARVDRYTDEVVNNTLRQSLYVLWAAVAAVLLICCANLANLLLARGAGREREVAIRSALGAGRWRLIRQFLTESVLLAGLGGAAGIPIALGLIAALKLRMPPFFLPPEAVVSLDGRVLAFTVGIAILTGILFGIAPAIQASGQDLGGALKEGGRGATSGAGKKSVRNALVVAEVALSFILLSGAGLLIRSFYRLQQVDPGFEATNVITMGLPMTSEQYPDGPRVVGYLGQVLEKIAAVPGVRSVATTSALPLQGWGWGMPFLVEGQTEVDRANRPNCFFKMVSPSYASALRMRMLKGRFLAETDTAGAVPVIVIDQSMEKQYFKEQNPIGKRILIQQLITGKHELGPEVPWQVVGVIADEKVDDLGQSSPGVYVSYKQSPVPFAELVIRGAMDPNRLVKTVQGAVWELNKNQALDDIKTLEQIKVESLGPNRLRTTLLGAFAGLALLLAAVGIYGVISYLQIQRTHELGVRAALGAGNLDQLALVLRSGMLLTSIGLGIGVLGALSLNRILSSLLFGVSPRDPWILAAVSILLVVVSVAACYIPALRAARVDPMVALRHE